MHSKYSYKAFYVFDVVWHNHLKDMCTLLSKSRKNYKMTLANFINWRITQMFSHPKYHMTDWEYLLTAKKYIHFKYRLLSKCVIEIVKTKWDNIVLYIYTSITIWTSQWEHLNNSAARYTFNSTKYFTSAIMFAINAIK